MSDDLCRKLETIFHHLVKGVEFLEDLRQLQHAHLVVRMKLTNISSAYLNFIVTISFQFVENDTSIICTDTFLDVD